MKISAEEECKGFLLTCEQGREKQAVKDAYNFLGEFIDKIYPDLQGHHANLDDELKHLQDKGSRVLYSIETNVKCCVFIKINPNYKVDPLKVVEGIMEDMKDNDRQLTRYCHRVLPVEKAFRAEFFRMKDALEELLEAKTKGEKHSWALHFKSRNNDKFKYKEVLKTVTEIATNFGHFTDIYYPEWTISIEISNHLMCVSIFEKFRQNSEFKLKKINVEPLPHKKQEQEQAQQLKEPEEEVKKPQQPKLDQSAQQRIQEQDAEAKRKAEVRRKRLLEQKIEVKEDDTQFI